MRITVAVLGIASTSFSGCKEKVSSEDLVKLVAEIKKDNEGKLHPLEIEMLNNGGDFKGVNSSDRRYAKKTLNSAFRNAKKPMTKDELKATVAELEQVYGPVAELHWARQLVDEFDTLNGDQNARLASLLRSDIERAKKSATRVKAVTDRIDAIRAKHGTHLPLFEQHLLDIIVQEEPVNTEAGSKSVSELLDDIYGESPKFKPVTKKEIEDMLARTDGVSAYTGSRLVAILDNYDEVPEAALKRIKGWFQYLDRKAAKYAAGQKALESV